MGTNETIKPKAGEGSGLWILKVLAGLLLVLVLIIHLIVNHFTAPNGLLSWQEVVTYYNNPLIIALEGFFLAVVLTHAALGLRSILLDLNMKVRTRRMLDIALALIAGGLFVYGVWILFKVSQF